MVSEGPQGKGGLRKKGVRGQIRKAGFDQTTPLVRQLSFGTYNQKCKPNRRLMDWLLK